MARNDMRMISEQPHAALTLSKKYAIVYALMGFFPKCAVQLGLHSRLVKAILKTEQLMRNRNDKRPAVLDLTSDQPKPAADGSYSTTFCITATGYWPDGRPTAAVITIKEGDNEISSSALDIQDGTTLYPVTGLIAGHHYILHVTTGGKEIMRVLEVSQPTPKSPTEIKLAEMQAELAQANVDLQLRDAKTKLNPPKVRPTHLQLNRVEGKPGNYTITVTVLSKDGTNAGIGVPSVVLTISEHGGKRYSATTNTNGIYVFLSNVTRRQKEKDVTVSVDGTEITTTTKLLGPPPPQRERNYARENK